MFDGSNLAGKTLVAFEKLYYGDKLYAVHTDLEDEDQTIHVPAAGTTASDKNTGTHHAYAGEYVELTDTIEYRNLLPGETYTLHGTVVEKETEQRLSEEKQQELFRKRQMAVLKLHLKSMELICREKRQSYMKRLK